MRMIWVCAMLFFALIGCAPQTETTDKADGGQKQPEVIAVGEQTKVYQNERFKEVTVVKEKDDTFIVTGKAQVFEAHFNYVVEDGHNELAKGTVQANKGAPEWGDFQFKVQVKKEIGNSTLTLILFEESAKDGSRQFELPIPLP